MERKPGAAGNPREDPRLARAVRLCRNLVVRALPSEDAYEVLSGNHRLALLAEADVKTVPCVIVEVDDAHARLLAQTLNRTRGRDDPEAYRKLLEHVLETLSKDAVIELLPETASSLDAARSEAPIVQAEPVFGVIVACSDEYEQRELLDTLLEEGFECRALLT